ncbi:MAG TPA: rhomboid family intramembrane serine protease [Polyangiaceae bacterium]|nr:rhomboid family intramembrane serine protease [Polyangiaceae bacterium]
MTTQQPEPAPRAARAGLAGGAPATVGFAALSVAVYLALIASSGGPRAPISGRMALRWGALAGDLGWREPWRQLSAMFVHFGLLHIGFNVLALFSFGRVLERVLGSARFAVLLLVSGALGFVVSDVWYALFPPAQITGGLSGGIFGLLGAEVGLRFAAGDAGWKRAAVTGAGYAVMMGLIPGQNVNNAAHVGGLLSGGLLGWALSHAASRAYHRFFELAALLLSAASLGAIALSRWG